MKEQKIVKRRIEKAVDPDTVNALIGVNDRLANVRNVLNHVYETMSDDLASGALYGMMCALDGIRHDLYAVTDGLPV